MALNKTAEYKKARPGLSGIEPVMRDCRTKGPHSPVIFPKAAGTCKEGALGNIYVTADIHGNYEKYRRLLKTIRFSAGDTLYVIGDVVDRGPEPMKVLLDMMGRPNVIPLLGNHEYMALQCLRFLMTEAANKPLEEQNSDFIEGFQGWLRDGGAATVRDFCRLPAEKQRTVLEYISGFRACEEVRAGGNRYVLIHAGGLRDFSPDKPLRSYRLYDMIAARADYSRVYYPDRYLATGHTPTDTIPGNPRPGRIYRANRHIAIDCGCGFGGPLGGVCLDTGKEFYVL